MLNWEMELKRWCPSFKILTYYGAQKERKLKRQVWSSVWSLSLLMSFSFRSFLYVNYLAYFPVASFSCWYYLISSNLISVFEYFNTSFISPCVFLCFFFFHFIICCFLSLWPLRAGPSPMLSMCVSHLTSWCYRITRLFVVRTGAISFWMRLRTSRISSPNGGSHCSTSTGKNEYRDLWESCLGVKGWLPGLRVY